VLTKGFLRLGGAEGRHRRAHRRNETAGQEERRRPVPGEPAEVACDPADDDARSRFHRAVELGKAQDPVDASLVATRLAETDDDLGLDVVAVGISNKGVVALYALGRTASEADAGQVFRQSEAPALRAALDHVGIAGCRRRR
jgi:hypothetical protein